MSNTLSLFSKNLTTKDLSNIIKKLSAEQRVRITRLDLSNNQLTELPKNIGKLVNLENLDLSNNQLTELPKHIGKLVNLQNLDLSNNQLTALPENIGKLVNLKNLDLSYNQFETLPENIGELVNLENLYLLHNQLETLPENIEKLENLQNLDLSNNQLTALPENIGKLVNLKNLDLSYNQFETLPENIGELVNLENLYLLHNQLETLPENIEKLVNLKNLYLSYNQFETLPENIGKLVNLKNLYLSYNQFETLPENIGKLVNLKNLHLSNNQLDKLPENIGELVNLENLDLSYNQLETLPEDIEKLVNLENLHLSKNQLTELPESITEMTMLTSLHLYKNQLTALPENIGELVNLENLDLSSNQFEILPENIGKLKNLENLSLRYNQLTELPKDIEKLVNLENLDLSKNQLETLPEDIGKLVNLKNLYLENNQLTALPESITEMTMLRSLDLGDNPLTDETIRFIGEIIDERLPSLMVSYNRDAYDAVGDWKKILGETKYKDNEKIIKIINAKEDVRLFLEKASISPLYETQKNNIIKGLNYLLDKVISDDKEVFEPAIILMKVQTGDCATPITNCILQQYILAKIEEIQVETGKILTEAEIYEKIEKGPLTQMVLLEWIAKHSTLLKMAQNEAVEQAQGLINSITLKNADQNEKNKIKFNNRDDKYFAPSCTEYKHYAFMQVTEVTAKAFRQELGDGKGGVNYIKLEKIVREYFNEITQNLYNIDNKLVNEIYKQKEDLIRRENDSTELYKALGFMSADSGAVGEKDHKGNIFTEIKKIREQTPDISNENIEKLLIVKAKESIKSLWEEIEKQKQINNFQPQNAQRGLGNLQDSGIKSNIATNSQADNNEKQQQSMSELQKIFGDTISILSNDSTFSINNEFSYRGNNPHYNGKIQENGDIAIIRSNPMSNSMPDRTFAILTYDQREKLKKIDAKVHVNGTLINQPQTRQM